MKEDYKEYVNNLSLEQFSTIFGMIYESNGVMGRMSESYNFFTDKVIEKMFKKYKEKGAAGG